MSWLYTSSDCVSSSIVAPCSLVYGSQSGSPSAPGMPLRAKLIHARLTCSPNFPLWCANTKLPQAQLQPYSSSSFFHLPQHLRIVLSTFLISFISSLDIQNQAYTHTTKTYCTDLQKVDISF